MVCDGRLQYSIVIDENLREWSHLLFRGITSRYRSHRWKTVDVAFRKCKLSRSLCHLQRVVARGSREASVADPPAPEEVDEATKIVAVFTSGTAECVPQLLQGYVRSDL